MIPLFFILGVLVDIKHELKKINKKLKQRVNNMLSFGDVGYYGWCIKVG